MKGGTAENIGRHSRLLVAGIFLATGLLTLPSIITLPAPGTDYSWMVGLNMGMARGFQFGRDIVFIFGPLGFA